MFGSDWNVANSYFRILLLHMFAGKGLQTQKERRRGAGQLVYGALTTSDAVSFFHLTAGTDPRQRPFTRRSNSD